MKRIIICIFCFILAGCELENKSLTHKEVKNRLEENYNLYFTFSQNPNASINLDNECFSSNLKDTTCPRALKIPEFKYGGTINLLDKESNNEIQAVFSINNKENISFLNFIFFEDNNTYIYLNEIKTGKKYIQIYNDSTQCTYYLDENENKDKCNDSQIDKAKEISNEVNNILVSLEITVDDLKLYFEQTADEEFNNIEKLYSNIYEKQELSTEEIEMILLENNYKIVKENNEIRVYNEENQESYIGIYKNNELIKVKIDDLKHQDYDTKEMELFIFPDYSIKSIEASKKEKKCEYDYITFTSNDYCTSEQEGKSNTLYLTFQTNTENIGLRKEEIVKYFLNNTP
ncbi:hypothetical protein [Breznakia pachnodae]|uniref:Lipoprotein n=1 Tax=Breznakia pachnodae TaxID=265178 RepID=A0ABU0E673_9FIRM|nr:hypothetical protein [Breznakia pachnodae]MDQ0362295.1 hypothetical protein [Breznakia pachnodae]